MPSPIATSTTVPGSINIGSQGSNNINNTGSNNSFYLTQTPTPATQITFSQDDVQSTSPDYPYAKKLTIYSNVTIQPLKLGIVFEQGDEVDLKTIVGWGMEAAGAEMSGMKGWSTAVAHYPNGAALPAVSIFYQWDNFPLGPNTPYQVTLQSKKPILVENVVEEPYQ
jgi:hypothetical protein